MLISACPPRPNDTGKDDLVRMLAELPQGGSPDLVDECSAFLRPGQDIVRWGFSQYFRPITTCHGVVKTAGRWRSVPVQVGLDYQKPGSSSASSFSCSRGADQVDLCIETAGIKEVSQPRTSQTLSCGLGPASASRTSCSAFRRS